MKTKLWALLAVALLLAACSLEATEPTQQTKPTGPGTPTPQAKSISSSSVGGKILFVKDGAIWIWQNGNSRKLTSGAPLEAPSWSPDGKRVAAVQRGDNYSDLVVLNENGKTEKKLTKFGPTPRPQDSTWARRPMWSPVSNKIAFAADLGTYRFGLWTIGADGSGLTKVNYRVLGDGDTDAPTWSNDGKSLAFVAFWEPVSQIYVVNLSTGATKKLTDRQHGAYDPSWSPDGRKIAYVARSEGKNDIWVMDADGSNATSITSLGTARTPSWSPDGQSIAFLASDNQNFDLYTVSIPSGSGGSASSEPKQLTKGQSIDAAVGISWTK